MASAIQKYPDSLLTGQTHFFVGVSKYLKLLFVLFRYKVKLVPGTTRRGKGELKLVYGCDMVLYDALNFL